MVPYFLNLALGDEDPIIQISIDNSRNILYTLSEKGSIEVYDMGEKGNGMSRITRVTQASLVQQAVNIVKYVLITLINLQKLYNSFFFKGHSTVKILDRS